MKKRNIIITVIILFLVFSCSPYYLMAYEELEAELSSLKKQEERMERLKITLSSLFVLTEGSGRGELVDDILNEILERINIIEERIESRIKELEKSFCTKDSHKKAYLSIDGDVVYCDSEFNMWTETIRDKKSWSNTRSGDGDLGDCNQKGEEFEACFACNELKYGGYDDWKLPSCESKEQDSDCLLYSFAMDVCDWDQGGVHGKAERCIPREWDSNATLFVDSYWTSTEFNENFAYRVRFNEGMLSSGLKDDSHHIRCVR
jgi:hypothetical protein